MKRHATISNEQHPGEEEKEEVEMEMKDMKIDKFYEIIRNYRRARDSTRQPLRVDPQPSSTEREVAAEVEEEAGEKKNNKRMRVEEAATAVNTNGGNNNDGGGGLGDCKLAFKWEDFMETSNQLVQFRRSSPLIIPPVNCSERTMDKSDKLINHGDDDDDGGDDPSNSTKEIDDGGRNGARLDLNLSL